MTTTKVEYSKVLLSRDYVAKYKIPSLQFNKECEVDKHLCEVALVGDPRSLYFDIEYPRDEVEFSLDECIASLDYLVRKELKRVVTSPQKTWIKKRIATSHGVGEIGYFEGIEKISMHIVFQIKDGNTKASKMCLFKNRDDLRQFIDHLTAVIMKPTCGASQRRSMSLTWVRLGKRIPVFDLTVYGKTQQMRCLGQTKKGSIRKLEPSTNCTSPSVMMISPKLEVCQFVTFDGSKIRKIPWGDLLQAMIWKHTSTEPSSNIFTDEEYKFLNEIPNLNKRERQLRSVWIYVGKCIKQYGLMREYDEDDTFGVWRDWSCGYYEGEAFEKKQDDMRELWNEFTPSGEKHNLDLVKRIAERASLQSSNDEEAEIKIKRIPFDPQDDFDLYGFTKLYDKKVLQRSEIPQLMGDFCAVVGCIVDGKASYVVKKESDEGEMVFDFVKTRKLQENFSIKIKGDGDDKPKTIDMNAIQKMVGMRNGYSSVQFVPRSPHEELKVEKYLNMFRGFEAKLTEPPLSDVRSEAITAFKYHIKEIWASGNEEYAHHIFSFFAGIIQDPKSMAGVIIVLMGKPGCGKSILIDWLVTHVFGRWTAFTTDGFQKILGQFNGIMNGKLLCHIAEAHTGGEKYRDAFQKLKSYATDAYIVNERKGVDAVQVRNYARFIITTNEQIPVLVEEGDRRYSIFECSDKHLQDHEYSKELMKKLESPSGADDIFTWLANYDYDKELKPISTEVKKALQLHSMNKADEFFEAVLNNEVDGIDVMKRKDRSYIRANECYTYYIGWSTSIGEKERMKKKTFDLLTRRRKKDIKVDGITGKYVCVNSHV